MCGIAGIVNFNNGDVLVENVETMIGAIKHRGPDDEGIFLKENIGLGFVRLSILDLSLAGHQPMKSKDGKFVIIFNGEVYNYIEIREELKDKYEFKTGTDTEVVLAAYMEWGKECLPRFNGMFSFVILNTETKDIFGARDRFGIKPFYYYHDNERFLFASEIKSILPLLENKKANNQLIYDYLLYNRTDHSNATFFEGIRKIDHGGWFEITNSKVNFGKWYELSDRVQGTEELDVKQYRKLFQESIRLRLRADVPIGVTLSGGIDSSAITASLVKDFDIDSLNTFSAVYGRDDENDEGEFIEEFNGIVKNMNFTSPDATNFFNEFETFIDTHNEPMPDTSPYVQYKVMEVASKHVKVTLDGQGADEQLAGYHYFFGSYYIELLRKFKISGLFSEIYWYLKKHKKILALKYFMYYLLPSRFQVNVNNHFSPSIQKSFIQEYKNSKVNELLYKPKSLKQSLIQHFEYKLEHLLRYEDLNSMHFSIESRVPFLDHRLVEATIKTPSNMKIFQGETKHILRHALKDILPEKIFNRKDKKGFSNPRAEWFRSKEFQVYILDLLNSESFRKRGYFDEKIAKSQYEKHLRKEGDMSREIWKWINLELWFRNFID